MRSPWILLCVLMFSLSSCFEVVEEIDMSVDGSGTYLYTVNLSQSRTKLTQIMRLDSINGHKVPGVSEIQQELDALVSKANSVKGISKVEKTEDFENFIFTFSCEFEHIERMNDLLVAIARGQKLDGRTVPNDHFSYNETTKTLRRKGDYSMKSDFDKIKDRDKMILDDAMFTSIFKTDGEIVSASNLSSKVSPNNKALLYRVELLDIVNEEVEIGNTIQLK